jgi:dihydrofolate reductase
MTVNEASFTDGGNTRREAVPPGTNAGAVSCATAKDGEITGNAAAVSSAIVARPRIALIWAMARNRVIGRHNRLPWRLPVDMQHFRELTSGHPVLMGRKTFESLGRPLPNRTNIVITSDRGYAPNGCLVAHSLDEAIAMAVPHVPPNDPEIFVIGGAQLYAQMLPRADRLYVTLVETEVEGDAWFPEFDLQAWHETQRDAHPGDAKNPYPCVFLTLERKTPGVDDRGVLIPCEKNL